MGRSRTETTRTPLRKTEKTEVVLAPSNDALVAMLSRITRTVFGSADEQRIRWRLDLEHRLLIAGTRRNPGNTRTLFLKPLTGQESTA